MTISRSDNKIKYDCNGSTVAFAFEFPILASTDLVVTLINEITGEETILIEGTHYAVAASDSGYGGGGTVTTQAAGETGMEDYAYSSSYKLLIQRSTPKTQLIDLRTGQNTDLAVIEAAFDKLQSQILDMQESIDRCIKFPAQDVTTLLSTIAAATSRANKFLAFDSEGDAQASSGPIVGINPTTYAESLLGAEDAGEALSTLGLPAGISPYIKTLLDDITPLAARATLEADHGVTYVDDYAAGDGVTDDTAAVAAAITAAPTGGILQFGAKTYKITDEIAIDKALTICGYGYTSQIKQVTGSKGVFVGSVSGISVYDLYHYGPQYGAYAGEVAIKVTGASAAAMVEKIKVEGCFFKNWGYGATYFEFVKQFSVFKNVIENVHHTGICAICSTDGDVSYNYINDIPSSAPVGWNAYGIIVTRNPIDSLTDSPRASRITIIGNNVRNIPTWDGINTHAGSELLIANNQVYSCYQGISITDCPGTDGTTLYAPQNVKVIGNQIFGSGDGLSSCGIFLNGSTDGEGLEDVVEWADGCSIIGNTVYGHGLEASAGSGGIFFTVTRGLVCTGNTARYCSPSGIMPYALNLDFVVSGCSCFDIWTNTGAVGEAVGVNVFTVQNVNFVISDITASQFGAGGATYLLNNAGGSAVKVGNSAGNAGKLGLVHGNATTLLTDAGSKISKNLNT